MTTVDALGKQHGCQSSHGRCWEGACQCKRAHMLCSVHALQLVSFPACFLSVFLFILPPLFFLIHVTTPQTYTRTHTGKYHLAVCKAVACKEPSHITSLPIARTLRKPLRASVFFTPLVFIIIVISSAVSAYSSFSSSSSRAVHRHRKPTAAFVPITTSSSCCCCRCCSSVVERFRMPRK